jgi:uroporphyrinogen decarboxylase
MKRDMKKWINKVSNSNERLSMPIMTYPGLKLINKNVMDVIKNGDNQFECIKALSEKYPSIAAVTIMDLSLDAEAFGSPIRYGAEEVPTVISKIIDGEASAKALKIPKVGDGRTSVYLRAAELAAKAIKDRPTFGGEIGPFSLAGRLFDMTDIMITLFDEPETVHLVLEKITSFLIEYAKAFKNAGANGIIIAEPAAGLLSPQQCEEFSSRYVKQIVDAVQDNNFIVILHNCGNTKNLIPSLLSTGALAFHFGNAVDMLDIMPQIPWGRLAFGNIDPARTFKNGTIEDMKEKTWELLEKTAVYKNFVLSSGCDVPPGTSMENIDMFFETLDRFNKIEFAHNTVA